MIMDRCAYCPIAPDSICPRWPANHTRYCEWVDPDHPGYRPNGAEALIRMASGQPPVMPQVTENPPPVAALPPTPQNMGLMLAGDLVEAVAKRIGAARLAKWIEAKTGQPCHCDARRDALNRLSEKLLKWAKLRL
jgi:hypothetical protein